jgi:hypothetical protein
MSSTFTDQITIVRRFLRDPDANIWDTSQLKLYWNAVQIEIAQKIGFLELAHSYRYPPSYTFSFMHEWEKAHAEGDTYQCFTPLQQQGIVCTYPWEAAYWMDQAAPADEGMRFTHPWESAYATPADVVKLPLHVDYNKMKYVAWDEETITPLNEKQIALHDGSYRTCAGDPQHYYHPDEEHNEVVLYPRPSAVTWAEDNIVTNETVGLQDDEGLISWREDGLTEQDTGLTIEQIDTEGQLFCVFEALPQAIDDDIDTIEDWPDYMLYALRAGTLERAFGANTDGFIPSLRDYWKMRKETAIKAIKLFKQARSKDRDYRLGGYGRKTGQHSTLRLPSSYPAI